MRVVRRYRDFLVQKATGLSFLDWYPVSAIQSIPWVLLFAFGSVVGRLLPVSNYWVSIALLAMPGLLGWVYAQTIMVRAHFEELRARMVKNG
ncbi:MAG: hypothetical protein ABIS14_05175 [Sphingomonas sp.]